MIRKLINVIIISVRDNDNHCCRCLCTTVNERKCFDVHKTYINIVGYGIPTRGPSIWKLDNLLLSDLSFVPEMKAKIPQWTSEAETDLPDNTGL